MNQTYQIVLILKGIVQRSDPLTISIHQDISLFSEASCLKEERGKKPLSTSTSSFHRMDIYGCFMGLFKITEQRSLFIGIQSAQVTSQGISAGL